MSHTNYTMQLDRNWDVTLDSVGGLAMTGGAAAIAQNVANECRLFTNDAYFAKEQGIPHFLVELGAKAPQSMLQSYLQTAALGVDGVEQVTKISFDSFDQETRVLRGDIEFSTTDGDHVALEL